MARLYLDGEPCGVLSARQPHQCRGRGTTRILAFCQPRSLRRRPTIRSSTTHRSRRVAALPDGAYTTSVTLWADGGPLIAGLERDFARAGVLDEEFHLLGVRRRDSRAAPPTDAERAALAQNRPSTRTTVARTAGTSAVLLPTCDAAAHSLPDLHRCGRGRPGRALSRPRGWFAALGDRVLRDMRNPTRLKRRMHFWRTTTAGRTRDNPACQKAETRSPRSPRRACSSRPWTATASSQAVLR